MARTGIRLLVVLLEGVMTSLEIEWTIVGVDIVTVVFDVGVSDRIHGIEPWVFVLLKDEVDPPVDVDWRWRFDVGLNEGRRTLDVTGFDWGLILVFVDWVGGDGRRATDRCRRGWAIVLLFVDDNGAVSGLERCFPFDNDGLVRDCFTREGGTRVITPTVGVEACNSTQTYTQMCLEEKSQTKERNRI